MGRPPDSGALGAAQRRRRGPDRRRAQPLAVVRKVFFDTSVLVHGIIDFGTASDPAQQLMRTVARGDLERPATAWHCCLGFFSVTTRLPQEFRLSPDVAAVLVEEELLARLEVHPLPGAQQRDLVLAAASERLAGGRIYDAHIGQMALDSGASTLTTDNRRHFTTLLRHGLRVLTSAEAVAFLGL